MLEAQQQLFRAEISLAQTRRDQLVAVVNLYRALGGGMAGGGAGTRRRANRPGSAVKRGEEAGMSVGRATLGRFDPVSGVPSPWVGAGGMIMPRR